MKNKNIFSLVLFLSVFFLPSLWEGSGTGCLSAQQLPTINIKRPFQVDYADSTRTFGPVIAINNNGEMMGIANSVVENPYTSTPHLYKIDSTGKYIWLKTFKFSTPYKREEFGGIFLNQNNLYIFGRTQDGGSGYADSYNSFIIKTDTAGNLLWKSKWGEDGLSEGATAITACSDGGIAFSSWTETGGLRYDSSGLAYVPSKCDVIKYRANGTIAFNKAFQIPLSSIDPGGIFCYFKTIVETPDKGYLLSGDASPDSRKNYGSAKTTNLFLLKLDSLGNKQWDKALMYDYDLYFAKGLSVYDMIPHPLGGYVLVGIGNIFPWETDPSSIPRDSSCGQVVVVNGVKRYYNIDYQGALMMKISETGNVEWVKTHYDYGPPIAKGRTCADINRHYPAGIGLTKLTLTTSTVSSQGFIISGGRSENVNPNGSTHQLIVKTDLNGNMLWSREYGARVNTYAGLKIYEESGGSLIVNTLASPDPADPDGSILSASGQPGDIGILRLNHKGYLQDSTCTLNPRVLVHNWDTLYSFVSNISYSTTPTIIRPLAAVAISSDKFPAVKQGDCYSSILAGFSIRATECDKNSDGSTIYVNTNFSSIGAAWYRWDYGDSASGLNNISDSAYGYHFYQNPGTYTITLTIWDNDSTHTDTISKNVVIAAKRYLTISPADTTVCQTQSIQLKASLSSGYFKGSSYEHYPFAIINKDIANYTQSATDSTFLTTPLDTTLQFYINTYGNTCVESDTATIHVLPAVNFAIKGDTLICLGDSSLLIASGSSTYLWNPTGSSNDSLWVSPSTTTTFYLSSGQNQTCGVDSASIKVIVHSLPELTLEHEKIIFPGQQTSLLASGGVTYFWSPAFGLNSVSISNPIANPIESTTYSVAVTDANGCVAYDTVRVDVNTCGENVFVPTAFSPNGDGQNDVLSINTANNNCIQTFDFKLFNRWGNLVFESSNITIAWDGTFKNKVLDADVFVYYLNAVFETGDVIIQKGNVSLIR